MNADETALNDHFLVGMGLMLDASTDNPNPPFVLLADNQPAATIDASKVYGLWSIQPGVSKRVQSDGLALQLGVAYFKIVAPLGSLEAADAARALRDQCLGIFKNWRSDDLAMEAYQTGQSNPPSTTDYQIKVTIYWRSLRTS